MKCWHCQSKLVWNADFDFEDYGIEGDGIVTNLTCSNSECGCEVECRLPIKTIKGEK